MMVLLIPSLFPGSTTNIANDEISGLGFQHLAFPKIGRYHRQGRKDSNASPAEGTSFAPHSLRNGTKNLQFGLAFFGLPVLAPAWLSVAPA